MEEKRVERGKEIKEENRPRKSKGKRMEEDRRRQKSNWEKNSGTGVEKKRSRV